MFDTRNVESSVVSLPSISFYTSLFTKDNHCKINPSRCNEETPLESMYDDRISIKTLSNFTLSTNDFLKSYVVYDVGLQEKVNCSSLGRMRKMFDTFEVFYSLFGRSFQLQNHPSYIINYKTPKRPLIFIELGHLVDEVAITVHSPLSVPNYEDFIFAAVKAGRNQFAYTSFKVQLLPSPYKSQCVSYAKRFGYSSQTLLSECIAIKTWKRCNATAVKVTHNITEDIRRAIVAEECDIQVLKECSRAFSFPDCEVNIYSTEVRRVQANSETKLIEIERPSASVINFMQVPRFQLLDLFLYIGGTLALFCGFSIRSVLTEILNALQQLQLQKKRYLNRNQVWCLRTKQSTPKQTQFAYLLAAVGTIWSIRALLLQYNLQEAHVSYGIEMPKVDYLPAITFKVDHKTKSNGSLISKCNQVDSFKTRSLCKDFTSSFVNNSVCETYFKRSISCKHSEYYRLDMKSDSNSLFLFTFMNDVKSLQVFMHPPTADGCTIQEEGEWLSSKKGEEVVITYTKSEYFFLNGLQSEDCKIFKSLNVNGRVLRNVCLVFVS